jgi:hypothetical protein
MSKDFLFNNLINQIINNKNKKFNFNTRNDSAPLIMTLCKHVSGTNVFVQKHHYQ